MRLPIVLPVTIFLGIGPALVAQMPPEAHPDSEALIRQLGSPSFAQRESAAKRLMDLGADALPALEKAESHPNAEVRRRVGELLPTVRRAVALMPSRVTLAGGPRKLSEILKDIETQTGNRITLELAVPDREYSFRMRDVTFWEAMEWIRTEAGVSLQVDADETSIFVKAGGPHAPHVWLDGAFRGELVHIHEDRDIDFRRDGHHDHKLTLTVAVMAEPRFLIRAVYPARVENAVNDSGIKMPSVAGPGEPEFESGMGKVQVRRAAEGGEAIRELSVTLPLQVRTGRTPIVVTEDVLNAEGLEFEIRGHSFTILGADLDDDGEATIGLIVPPDENAIPVDWHKRIRVEDSGGSVLRPYSRGTGWRSGRPFIDQDFRPSVPPNGPPKRLIVEDWITYPCPVRFQFKNVRLP